MKGRTGTTVTFRSAALPVIALFFFFFFVFRIDLTVYPAHLQEKTRRAQTIATGRSDVRRARADTAQQSHTRIAESHAETRPDAADGLRAIPTEQRPGQLLFAAAEHPRSLRHAPVAEGTQSKRAQHVQV